MAQIQRSSDSKAVPDLLVSVPHAAHLKGTGAVAVTTPTTAAIVTDGDAWTAGVQQPAVASGGPVIDATAGTVTITRDGNYRVSYGQCQLTKVNSQVITLEVYKGTTASGGISKFTQPATAVEVPFMGGTAFVTCVVGNVLSLKVICDTGSYGAIAGGFFHVEEL